MSDQTLEREGVTTARAQARFVHVTPMKARRVVDLVREMQADKALTILRFAPQSASEPVYKVLASAVANARQKAERHGERLDVEDLLVHQAYVDEGPTMKRFRPRAQGRAYRVRKRTSHITIVVAPRPEDASSQGTSKQKPTSQKSSQKRRTR